MVSVITGCAYLDNFPTTFWLSVLLCCVFYYFIEMSLMLTLMFLVASAMSASTAGLV